MAFISLTRCLSDGSRHSEVLTGVLHGRYSSWGYLMLFLITSWFGKVKGNGDQIMVRAIWRQMANQAVNLRHAHQCGRVVQGAVHREEDPGVQGIPFPGAGLLLFLHCQKSCVFSPSVYTFIFSPLIPYLYPDLSPIRARYASDRAF